MPDKLYSLSDLFERRLFRIPDYQRGYAWQHSQFVDFWDDLNNLQMDHYHYTGLLSLKLLKHKEVESWGNDLWLVDRKNFKPCHIVDGQQRLTTFIILLNEIINFVCNLEENTKKKDEDILLGYVTINEIRSKYICQKRPPQNMITTYLFGYETDNPSDKYLRYKVFNEPDSIEVNETYYTKNLKAAKDFFFSNITAFYAEEGLEGIDRIYKKLTQKLMFILHEIDDDYDVFVAFETMNNRGKKLTNLELLKNRLIYLTTIYNNKVLDEKDKSELRKQINEAWKEVYYQLGRNKNIALSDDDFLRAHWIIYYSYSRKKGDDYIRFLLNKFSAKNVYEKKPVENVIEQTLIYEEALDDADEDDEVIADYVEETPEILLKLEPREIADYVNSLKDLAKYWYDTFFPDESPTLSGEEKLWLDRLYRIGIGYFRPLVTVVLSKCPCAEDRITLFKAIERFIFVCFRLANYKSTYQSSIYYAAAHNIYIGKTTVQKVTAALNSTVNTNIQYAIQNYITDIEKKLSSGKREGYYSWNSLRYFLYEYEYSLWESTGVKKPSWELFSKSENEKVSIEHILPQTPSKWYWKNQFRQYINNDSEMAALTGSLGNLLPLAQSINSSLQNDSFDEKKNPTGSERRGYSSGSNSEIEVAKEEAWDAQRIYKRCLDLLAFMEKRWCFEMTKEQKEALTLVSFIHDGRSIPEELPKTVEQSPISASEKRYAARFNYWTYALPIIRKAHGGKGHPYGKVSPSESSYKGGFFGLRCIHLYCSISLKKPLHCGVGLWIDTGIKEQNERVFDMLYSHKNEIESKISMPIKWNRKDEKRACSIDIILEDADFTDEEQWKKISEFHADMSKELSDHIVTAYEFELTNIDLSLPQSENRLTHLPELLMMWARSKEEEGKIILDRANCTKKFTRFTTDAMTEIYPFSKEASSGWNTRNYYFYEIVLTNHKELHMQFALSGKNLPDNLKEKSACILELFRVKGKKEGWDWKTPFKTPSIYISEDYSDEEIISTLDDYYDQLMEFESQLISAMPKEQ